MWIYHHWRFFNFLFRRYSYTSFECWCCLKRIYFTRKWRIFTNRKHKNNWNIIKYCFHILYFWIKYIIQSNNNNNNNNNRFMFFSKLESTLKRLFRDAMLHTVVDLTNTSETGANITDQRGPIDTPYMGCNLMHPFNLVAIVEVDNRNNPLPRRITATLPLTKLLQSHWTWVWPRVNYYNPLLTSRIPNPFQVLLDLMFTWWRRHGIGHYACCNQIGWWWLIDRGFLWNTWCI